MNLNIAAKVWLSIGIFLLGFVFLISLEQIEGRSNEGRLRTASEALFPAALLSQHADATFDRSVQYFGDAVVLHDLSEFASADEQGRLAVASLRAVAAIQGLSRERRAEATDLAVTVNRFLAEARLTYRPLAAGSRETPAGVQERVAELVRRAKSIEASLQRARERSSGALKDQLTFLQGRSARMRWLGLVAFALSLLISAALVNLTIRRSITVPLLRAEAELAHERDLLRILLDNIPDCIYFKDAKSRFIRINKAYSLVLGIEDESAANGRTDFDFFDPECARQSYEDERGIVRSGEPIISKMERSGRAGRTRWSTSTKVPVKDERGQVQGIVCVARDVTERKEALEALESSEESFRLLFAAIPHAVWVYDRKTLAFLEVNEAAARHYGYSAEEFRQIHVTAIYPPDEAERRQKRLAAHPGEPLRGAWKHLTKDGRILDVELTAQFFEFRGRPAVLVVAQDVTERRRLEVDLHQAQRLEAVGQLAAGIAHEINTPIQYVSDNMRFLQDAYVARQGLLESYSRLRLAAESGPVPPALLRDLDRAMEDADADYVAAEIPKAIEQALDGVERVACIVRAMKEFAHPGQKEKATTDLNKALATALIVAKNEYKYVADAETDFGDLPPVVCNLAEMNQVFLNLLVNAAHAIGAVAKGTQARGKIVVSTRQAGDRAAIRISDTGCGIPASIQSRIFDPFFTTKEVGRGTGQGLAIARSIVVEKHGGSLTFEPNGTQGTTFVVSIPIEPGPPGAPED